jgi:hypothetical protein
MGAWAYRKRLERFKTSEEAVAAMARLTGHHIRADTLRSIESGNHGPGPETLRALQMLYQSRAPEKEPEPAAELVAQLTQALAEQGRKMDRQTDAILALVNSVAPLATLAAAVVGAEGAEELRGLVAHQQDDAAPSASPGPRQR